MQIFANVSNLCLALLLKLVPFSFVMLIKQSVNFQLMMFTIFDYLCAHLPKVKKHKLIMIGFCLFMVGWQIKKALDLEPSPPNHANHY